jgi:ubiquinone/menaquinone biosynthesis C-methylase UbiE
MDRCVTKILERLELGDDHIYNSKFVSSGQEDEIQLRESVASTVYDNYLMEIASHHSITVMDKEVRLFLNLIPYNGIIVDVGGCWGWHWRRLMKQRPDVIVFVVDFVRANLKHAINVLGNMINKNVFLIHGDATQLPFPPYSFDGYWSVQMLQHIPNFLKAVQEAYRVLRVPGHFVNYSLNNNKVISLIYRLCGKQYQTKGIVSGNYYLARASKEQENIVAQVFQNQIVCRYTEILFQPDMKIQPGGKHSLWGRIDSYLSCNTQILSYIARQCSFHTTKFSDRK